MYDEVTVTLVRADGDVTTKGCCEKDQLTINIPSLLFWQYNGL